MSNEKCPDCGFELTSDRHKIRCVSVYRNISIWDRMALDSELAKESNKK